MDSSRRMPPNRRRMLERSVTNETPMRSTEQEERLSPPFEIFVRRFSLTERNLSCLDASSSAMTELSFDASFASASEPVFEEGVSTTSSISSLVDQAISPQYCRSGSGTGERCRFQANRRRRTRKSVMRWASMPQSKLQNRGLPDATLDLEDTPRLPKRQGSDPNFLSDSDDEEHAKAPNDYKNKQPRLPTRKKSSESLFSNLKASSSCGTEDIVVSAHAA